MPVRVCFVGLQAAPLGKLDMEVRQASAVVRFRQARVPPLPDCENLPVKSTSTSGQSGIHWLQFDVFGDPGPAASSRLALPARRSRRGTPQMYATDVTQYPIPEIFR